MTVRIGVSSIGPTPAEWVERCRRIEALGFDEISVADHLLEGCLSPMPALAAAAVVTDGIALSTLVLNNELRHPAVLANEAALVAELSGGRLRLGIGAGHAVDEHDKIGSALPPPQMRVERLAEAVPILRRLLTGESVTTSGRHFRLINQTAAPLPSRSVPLLVGGGSRRVLEVAATAADIVGFTGFSHVAGASRLTHFTASGLADRVEMVRSLAGERESGLALQALVQAVVLTEDREAAAASVVAEIEDLALEQALESPFLLLGTPDEIAAQLRDRTSRYGIETWTTFSGRPTDPPLEAAAEIIQVLNAAHAIDVTDPVAGARDR